MIGSLVTACQYRYDQMRGLNAYYKENDKSTDATEFGCGRPLTLDSTTDSLVSLCVSIKFIENWINVLANNFAWRCYAYHDNPKEIFKQIPTEIPTPTFEYFKRKHLTLLTDIGGDWLINTIHNPKPHIKNPR